MPIEFRKAARRATPMLIGISSVSGGGKTFSALLIAAGLAGPKGRVLMIDTENGRGEMYSDSPGILKALPDGFEYVRFDPPFSPERYTEYIRFAEQSGITVAVVDSFTHEWEGIGGCTEIAEKNPLGRMPNWSKAKMAHKRMLNHLLTSSMHVILCIRAREKVKIFKRGDLMVTNAAAVEQEAQVAEKDTVVSLGLQPITEKNAVFELTVSLQLDERTHHAVPIKVPEPLLPFFPGGRLLTKQDGEAIARWNSGGKTVEDIEQLMKRATTAAHDGVAAYRAFFAALTPEQRKLLKPQSEAMKLIAESADRESADAIEEVDALPDAVEFSVGALVKCAGKIHEVWDDGEMFRWREVAA